MIGIQYTVRRKKWFVFGLIIIIAVLFISI